METALKLAIEGGWKPKGQKFSVNSISYKVQALNKVKYKERFLLDKDFWVALGKGLGWSDYTQVITYHDKDRFNRDCTHSHNEVTWEHNWHNFITHLSENKDPSSFFEALINEKK